MTAAIRTLTPAALRAAIDAGLDDHAIGEQHGASAKTVQCWRIRYGFMRRDFKAPKKPLTFQEKTCTRLPMDIGSALPNTSHDGGLPLPPASFLRTWTPEQEAAVIACMARGMMPAAIARELGISKNRVEHKVRELRRRREDLQPAHTTPRRCLRCQRTFPSEHVGNRICRRCAARNAEVAPLATGVVR